MRTLEIVAPVLISGNKVTWILEMDHKLGTCALFESCHDGSNKTSVGNF